LALSLKRGSQEYQALPGGAANNKSFSSGKAGKRAIKYKKNYLCLSCGNERIKITGTLVTLSAAGACLVNLECGVALDILLRADRLDDGAVYVGNVDIGLRSQGLGQIVPDRSQLFAVPAPRSIVLYKPSLTII